MVPHAEGGTLAGRFLSFGKNFLQILGGGDFLQNLAEICENGWSRVRRQQLPKFLFGGLYPGENFPHDCTLMLRAEHWQGVFFPLGNIFCRFWGEGTFCGIWQKFVKMDGQAQELEGNNY